MNYWTDDVNLFQHKAEDKNVLRINHDFGSRIILRFCYMDDYC